MNTIIKHARGVRTDLKIEFVDIALMLKTNGAPRRFIVRHFDLANRRPANQSLSPRFSFPAPALAA